MDMNSFITTLKTPAEPPAGTDRMGYLLLAIFGGVLGVHNFWYGVTEKAKVQCLTGLIGCVACGLGPLVSWVTAVLEAWAYYSKSTTGKTGNESAGTSPDPAK